MMSCSKDISNDAEIVDILSKDYTTSPDCNEKPLSPILTGGVSNRRFLIGRRLSRKNSSRVKLTDRFKENDKGPLVVNPINVSLPVSFDDSLSASQTETLIDHLDKLEELDNSRKNLYKALVRDNGINDSFKKPKSPPPIKINKAERTVSIENNNSSQRSVPNLIPISSKNCAAGFQTAKGNSICVSESNLKTHSKLFEDIISPTQGWERQNKHAFLSKRNNFKQNRSETNTTLNSVDSSLRSYDLKYSSTPNSLVTLNLNISEKAIVQGKNFFGEEQFDDIKFNSENLGGFKKASAQSFVDANVPKNVKNYSKDEGLSLTQAICDSGISNTQMINAFDEILYSNDESKQDGFKGFTKDDKKASYSKCLNMENIIEHSHSMEFCKKRKRSMHFIDSYNCSSEECKRENDILPPKKRQRNYGNIEVNSTNTFKVTKNFGGFTSASGKSIAVSEKYMKDAEAIFNDIDFNPFQEKLTSIIDGFSKDNKDLVNKSSFIGFQKASGKSIKISENSLTKAKNIFDQLDVNVTNEKVHEKSVHPELISIENKQNLLKEKQVDSCTEYIENENHCEEKYFQNLSNLSSINQNRFTGNSSLKKDFVNVIAGFSKASGQKVQISETALNKTKNIFDNLSADYSNKSDDQTLVARTSITVTDKKEASCSDTHGSVKNTNVSKKFSVSEQMLHIETTPISVRKPLSSNLSVKGSKRKLGMSHFKPIQIDDSKLDRAKLLFDEDFLGISPLKPKQITTYTSTPIKQNDYLANIKKDCLIPKNSFSNFVDAAGITPIKKNIEHVQTAITFSTDSNILCLSPTKGDFLEDLETERKQLECRLRVLLEREKLGRKTLHQIQAGKSADDKKPRKGLLYRTKTASKRSSLVAFVNNRRPGEITSNIKLPINPKNAENVHFTRQTGASIATEDGAIIIPNSKDMVGLPELENAFEAMPGVEPRLIPKGWIKNHFKWIVWKLASYENMFPNHFPSCLTIENIMQQLKYRYDREIDRAERSAVRKVCEKDDAPQKRMVLFVSGIKMLDTKKYELELCDGWYAIRTIIDEPLCNQVINGKIEIGTKLLVSGAELLNCEGCHPLEVTSLVCLKINCNSTRRAVWHAKLGYQRNSNPFPIQLHSIHHHGGTIAAIKVCIARVYPLKYMERSEGGSVWRNRKAEEIASQKWENERSRKVEQIEHEVRKKFQNSEHPISEYQSLNSDISNIKCPERLCGILERSNDPECLEQNLSTSQKEAIITYQGNLSMKKQQEIAAEISANVSKMKLTKRDVVAVLKLLIIDSIGDSDRPFSFFIWRPTDVHLQSLKEGKTFTVQNVLPRINGDLNSTAKTTFKHESTNSDKYNKCKRRLVSLKELITLKTAPDFNEFDTVGIVVQTKIESWRQEVWIMDTDGRLLHISVYEGPSTCLLLDNLKRGQPTTVCNLVFRDLKKDILQAIANHLTVFSSYSQHKHLQEGLDAFKKEMPKDVQSLLKDCDNKIEVFTIITDINSFSGNFDVTDEDTFTAGT